MRKPRREELANKAGVSWIYFPPSAALQFGHS